MSPSIVHRRMRHVLVAFALFGAHAVQAQVSPLPPDYNREFIENLVIGLDTSAQAAAARVAPASKPATTAPSQSAMQRFSLALSELRADGAQAQADSARLLPQFGDAVRAADLLVEADFERLRQAGAAAAVDVSARIDIARARWRAQVNPLLALLDTLDAAAAQERATILANLLATIDAQNVTAPLGVYGAQILPQHRPRLLPRPPRMQPDVAPSYASGADLAPTAEDLTSTPEAQLSPAVLAQAQALGNDYIAIFDFVRSQVRTQWYAGAQKGADETLRTRAGNDADQASLLIALLRASSAGARYVTGVVEVPVADLARQMGVEPAQVGVALAATGIAHVPVVIAGRIGAFRIEHIWVAAHVPYENYRGSAADDHRRSWIPLMPALKPAQFTPAGEVLQTAALEVELWMQVYLAAVRDTLPWPALRDELNFRLSQRTPPLELAALGSRHVLDAAPIQLLPASTPYPVRAVNLEAADLLDEQRQWLHLVLRAGTVANDAVVLDAQWPLSQIGLKRLSLGYVPATVEDQHLANARGGLGTVPAYLVRVRPVLWLDGAPLLSGQGVLDTGVPHRIEIGLRAPGGEVSAQQSLIAGGIAALTLDTQGDAPPLPDDDRHSVSDPAALRVLGHLGARYAQEWSRSDAELAAVLGTTLVRPLPGATLTIAQYRVERVLGLSHSLKFEGVAIDALLRPIEPVAQRGVESVEADWLRMSALHGSALEHELFEQQWGVEAISADLGLQRASVAGIPRLALRPGDNVATLLAAHDVAVRDNVQGWLERGLDVEIARDPLQIEAWRGSVWRALNPATGETGYFIAGRYAGGATVIPPDLWTFPSLAALFANPYGGEPNDDPLAGFLLQLDESAQGQTGAAGTRLELPLSAYVSDELGRPVVAAQVTFTIREGDGRLDGGGETIVVPTDARGLAQTQLTLPQRQEGLGGYFYSEGDEFPQWGSINTVDVQVESSAGIITAEQPYRAFALPGAPVAVQLHNRTGATVLAPGLGYIGFDVAVVDAYDNPIHNQLVTASVSDVLNTPDCFGHDIGSAPRSGLFLPGACPADSDRYVGLPCTSTSVEVKTRPGGGSFNLAPTAAMESSINLSIASSAGSAGLTLRTAGDIRGDDEGRCLGWYWAGLIQTAYHLRSGYGTSFTGDVSMEAALPGTRFPVTRRFFGVSGAGHSWIGFNYYVPPGDTTVSLSGAQLLGPRFGGAGGEYDMQALAPGHVTGSITMPLPPPFDDGQVLRPPVPRAWVLDMPAPLIEPAPIQISAYQRSTGEFAISTGFSPSDYIGRNPTIELLADSQVESSCSQVYGDGAFLCRFGEGRPFDPTKQYSARYSINSGTPFYLQSPEVDIQLTRGIIAGFGVDTSNAPLPALNSFVARRYPKRIKIKHEIDVPTGWQCPETARFVYAVGQPARIKLDFYQLNQEGVRGSLAWTAVDAPLLAQGVYQVEVGTTDLKFGEFEYELRAVSAADGEEEVYIGRASNVPQRRDSLPLAHSFVKGVDLFSGHAVISAEDAAVDGRGPGLKFTRTYASHSGDELTFLGRGWNSNLDSQVVADRCGSLTVTGAAGQGQRFVADGVQSDGSIRYRALHGYHGTLVATLGGGFDFFAKDGTRYRFGELDPNGWRLSHIEDANANRVTYEYDRNTFPRQVKRIRDAAGRALEMVYRTVILSEGQPNTPYEYRFSRQLLTQVKGPLGLQINYTYDADSNLSTVTRTQGNNGGARSDSYRYVNRGGIWLPDPDGEFQYYHFGFRLDRARNGIDFSDRTYGYALGWSGVATDDGPIYLPEQRVIQVKEPDDGETDFVYSGVRGLGPVGAVVTDARRNDTTYELNGYGAATRVSDPAGTTRTDWNLVAMQPARVTDALGTVTDYEYDGEGNKALERTTHTAGVLTRRWEYHAPALFATPIKDRLRSFIDARLIETRTSHDSRGNLTGMARGGTSDTYVVADNGDRTSRSNGAGEVTLYRYDSFGYLSREFDALGTIAEFEYDALGRKTKQKDGRGNSTEFEYDARNRLVETRLPAAAVGLEGGAQSARRRVRYFDGPRQRVEINENRKETLYTHDPMGRVVSIADPRVGRRRFEYDRNGNALLETDWRGNATSFVYDEANRMTRRDEPLGRSTTFTHDALGHVLSETTAQRVTEYRYAHPTYLRTHVRRKLGTDWLETVDQFDGNGNSVQTTNARGIATTREFDERDRLITLNEPEGRVTAFEYDDADRKIGELLSGPRLTEQVRAWTYDQRGRELSRTDTTEQDWLSEYDGAGNVIRRTDPLGHAMNLSYDARNRLTAQTGPVEGRETRYGYDAVGNQTDELQANGRRIEHVFDEINRRTLSRDLSGNFLPNVYEATDYDAEGNVVSRTDANGNSTDFTVDALNRITQERRPLSRTLNWTHTIHGEVLTDTDALDRTTSHTVDAVGRRTSTTSPAPFSYLTTFVHDENGNLIESTNPRGFTTEWAYDGLDRRTGQTDPEVDSQQYVQSWVYDAAGNVVTQTDRRGIPTGTLFDGENRALELKRDGVVKWQRAYDAAGNLLRETDANGSITTLEYNAANEKTATRRPDAVSERWEYFAWGDVKRALDPDGIDTSFTYDLRHRVLTETRPHTAGPAVTQYRYDGHGNRTALVRPLGASATWTFEYDAAHRLSEVVTPEGARTEYGYDAADRRTLVEDAERRGTATQYDNLGRPTRIDYADGESETIDSYDGNGNATARTDPNGRAQAFAFDALDRRTTVSWGGNHVQRDIVSEITQYDPNGNAALIAQVDESGTRHETRRAWTRQERMREEIDRWSQPLALEYDAQDNREARTDAEGRTVFQNDRLNRLRSVQPASESAIALTYTPAGRIATQTYPNGSVASYEYDAAGRVATITHRQSGTEVAAYVYTYDANGNRLEETRTSGAGTRISTYSYDVDDRLTATEVVGEDAVRTRTIYTLDDVGNRLTEVVTRNSTTVANLSYDYNERHQLDSSSDSVGSVSTDYDYDANGNLIREQTGAQITTYRINPQDRIATLTGPAGPPVDYAYDSDGRRVEKRTTAEAVRYGWDGASLRRETNVTNNPLATYDWAGGRVLRTRRTNLTSYAQHDALKSPTRWSRADGGELARATYDAWGNASQQSGTLPPIGYTGYYADPESKLYYAQQRYYAPKLGRFTRIDPWAGDVLNPITLNKYLYANGNPLLYIDPTGQYAEAGHYYTTYYVALRAGYSDVEAQQLAFYSQVQDEADELDAIATQSDMIWSALAVLAPSPYATLPEMIAKRDATQRSGHALTGRLGSMETANTVRAIEKAGDDIITTGILIHRLGDSFAHRRVNVSTLDAPMYPTGFGHTEDTVADWNPDLIQNRPDRYLAYVQTLTRTLAAKQGKTQEQIEDLVASVSKDLSPVARITKLVPGTGEYFTVDDGSEFSGTYGSPAKFRSEEDLEELSIQELRGMIEARGGDSGFRPEAYPSKFEKWVAYLPVFEHSVENALENADAAMDGEVATESRLRGGVRHAQLLLDRERKRLQSEAEVVTESRDGDGATTK